MSEDIRILIADDPRGAELLVKALDGYKLTVAETFDEACAYLEEDGFCMIVCGIHFDESRMIDLLVESNKNQHHKDTPFVVFRGLPSGNQEMLRTTVAAMRSVHRMGPYLEMDDYSKADDPLLALRKDLEKLLPSKRKPK